MTLFEQIKADQLTARKAHNALASSLLTTLIGEAAAIGKNNGNRDVTDAEVVALVKKFVKGMDETLGFLGNHNAEATAVVLAEKDILAAYLPKQMDEASLTEVIRELIAVTGPNLGKLMAELKTQYAGLYDGKMASQIAKGFV
jgi:uncharacterized protein YqeY